MKFISGIMALAMLLATTITNIRAETESEWIALGTRIHGGFGPLIPLGIRIGLDAKDKIKADPRGLTLIYYTGEKAPCPCIADGIMLATQVSPGQGTLLIAAEKAPAGQLAAAIIRDRKTGRGFIYIVSDEWLPKIGEWIKTLDPPGRYQAVMKAEGLFRSSRLPRNSGECMPLPHF
jgi:formylmethanofuran dehydrogenase subunit E